MTPKSQSLFPPRKWTWVALGVALIVGLCLGPPTWSRYCQSRAVEALALRRFHESEEWLESARLLSRNDPAVEFLQARIDRRRGRLDDMLGRLKWCADHGIPRSVLQREAWMAQAQTGDLRDLHAHLPDLLMEDSGDDLREVCDAYVNGCILNYWLPEAQQVLELWIADFSEDPEPLFLLGRLQEHASQLDMAEQSYRQALEMEPRHAPAAYNLGRLLLFQRNQPDAALLAYRQSARHLEQPHPALVREAECLTKLNRLLEARSLLDHVLSLPSADIEEAYRVVGDPGASAPAQALAAYGRLELAAGDTESAIGWLQRAVEADPFDWKTRYLLGVSLSELGRVDEAAGHLEIVEQSSLAMAEMDTLLSRVPDEPDNADIRCRLGRIFMEFVSEQQGVVWLESALQVDPANADAHAALADYYSKRAAIDPRMQVLADEHRQHAASHSTAAPDAEQPPSHF